MIVALPSSAAGCRAVCWRQAAAQLLAAWRQGDPRSLDAALKNADGVSAASSPPPGGGEEERRDLLAGIAAEMRRTNRLHVSQAPGGDLCARLLDHLLSSPQA